MNLNRWLAYLMVPFVVFAGIVVVWAATVLLFVTAGVVANILRGFAGWFVKGLPEIVTVTFSDPLKIASLPVAVGIVILAGLWALEELTKNSRSDVMRGRRLGSSRAHQRAGRTCRDTRRNQRRGRTPWT